VSESPASLARAILGRNLHVGRGDSVIIESWNHTLDYTRAFVEETRRLGAQPSVLFESDAAWWSAVNSRMTGPFEHLSGAERAAVKEASAYIYFWGPADMRKAIDLGVFDSKFTGYNEEWYASARKGKLRGYRMSLGLASDETARHFGLRGPAWRGRLVAAGAVDAHKMLAKGNRLAGRLAQGSEMRIRHPNGTDLRITLRRSHPIVASGIPQGATTKQPRGMLEGNPSGQVFVALDGCDASGTLVSNRPVYDMGRYEIFGGSRRNFEHGRLVRHSTGLGRAVFEKAFRAAPKGRDRIGYLSIGLNPLARELPPCEDCEEGAILVGIGGNGVAGGKSRIPFTSFAMLGGGTISVDGKALAEGGRLA
jgi:leucyl aminopeptidase (aminopeptidase T)